MPIMPSFAIFLTVSTGKYSSASTCLARGLTSFSANSLYIFCTICCCLDRVKSICLSSLYLNKRPGAVLPAPGAKDVTELQRVHRGLGAVGVVDVEALAGLAAQVAAADHLADQRAGAVFAVAGLFVEHVHDGQADVQADEVAQLQGAHGVVGAQFHGGVDAGDVRDALHLDE